MKSFKVKALALAVFGLGGLAVAGTAMAVTGCPAGPDIASGGAWSAKSVDTKGSTLTIVAGGYDSSACKLQSSLENGGAAVAQVRDDSPLAPGEAHYRAQFIFDPTNLNAASGNNQAIIFQANAAATHNNVLPVVKILFAGSGGGSTTSGKRIFIYGACETGGLCGAPVTLPNQTGPNRIEIESIIGPSGTGTLNYWVNNASTTPIAESSKTAIALTGGNAGWIGTKTVFMGMSSPTSNYRSVNTNTNVWFDQFDSRRSTFIGH